MSRELDWRPRLDDETTRQWEDDSRQLISMEIKGLFGLYDYTIPLRNADSRIVFLHGPNGVGKSTILRLIKAYAEGDFEELMAVPFDEATLTFSDKTVVILGQSAKNRDARIEVRTGDAQTHQSKLEPSRRHRGWSDRPRADFQSWYDLFLVTLADDLDARRPPTTQMERMAAALDPGWRGWANAPRESRPTAPRTCVKLIEADRLHALHEGNLVERVTLQLDDLTDQVGRAQQDFFDAAGRLDKAYKRQLIEGQDDPKPRHEAVTERLATLYEVQNRLLGLGLARESDLLEPEQLMEVAQHLPSWKLAALDLSTRQSLELFESLEWIAVRLEALRDLVNDFYQDKGMQFEYGGKVQFVQLAGRRAILPPPSLSSGEKHIFTLLYTLLFPKEEEQGAQVVLIDEPELSLHLSWQRRFASALERIGEIRDLRYVLATHSPQIVGGRTDSMVALTYTHDPDHDEE